MRRQIIAGALAAVAMLGMAAPALAQGQSCFFASQWRGWKAADDHTIYLNISDGHRTFRLDMAGSCSAVLDPSATLINRDYSNTICSARDLELRFSQGHGVFVTRCIVDKMTQLSPEQAAALPRNLRP